MRIVIVEDQGFFLDLLTAALRGRGIDVTARATTKAEARHMVDNLAPDLALPDIRLTAARAIGYQGEERLGNLDELVDAFTRITRGEVAIGPHIIGKLMSRRRVADPLDELTPHERRALALVAEGRSNRGIARELHAKISTVEKQLSAITGKPALPETTGLSRRGSLYNQRVLAALTFLRGNGAAPS